MKRMIYTTKFISVLVFIALMLAACNKDEWKDDVDALKQPMPTGIVIMHGGERNLISAAFPGEPFRRGSYGR